MGRLMPADVDLGALTVELGLGDVAGVREPTWVLQARGEHRGDVRHTASIVATLPSSVRSRLRMGTLATVG